MTVAREHSGTPYLEDGVGIEVTGLAGRPTVRLHDEDGLHVDLSPAAADTLGTILRRLCRDDRDPLRRLVDQLYEAAAEAGHDYRLTSPVTAG